MRAEEKRLILILSELVLLIVGVCVSIFEFHFRASTLWGLNIIVGALALAIILMTYDRFRLLPQIHRERETVRGEEAREEPTIGLIRTAVILASVILALGMVAFVYVWANTFQ